MTDVAMPATQAHPGAPYYYGYQSPVPFNRWFPLAPRGPTGTFYDGPAYTAPASRSCSACLSGSPDGLGAYYRARQDWPAAPLGQVALADRVKGIAYGALVGLVAGAATAYVADKRAELPLTAIAGASGGALAGFFLFGGSATLV